MVTTVEDIMGAALMGAQRNAEFEVLRRMVTELVPTMLETVHQEMSRDDANPTVVINGLLCAHLHATSSLLFRLRDHHTMTAQERLLASREQGLIYVKAMEDFLRRGIGRNTEND